MSDIQATFFATLVDEWARSGVRDAVVGAGRRSTILSGLLEACVDIRVHVVIDERSGAHLALGLAMATGRPTVVWTTSGTATAELGAAVMEANHSNVPLIVCTADRPPELQHVRDWQAVDQRFLYLGATRWSYNPGVADAAMAGSWRSIAARSVGEALYHPSGPGPVHLNLPIREPWSFETGTLPAGRADGAPWHRWMPSTSLVDADSLRSLGAGRNGLIIAGKSTVDPLLVHRCAETLGWPVIAEVRSGTRLDRPNTITTYDALCRQPDLMNDLLPEVVVRFGMPLLSKSIAAWLKDAGIEDWMVDPHDTWSGSALDVSRIVRGEPSAFLTTLLDVAEPTDPAWLAKWQAVEAAGRAAVAEVLDAADAPFNEPVIGRALTAAMPQGTQLFASTSMPVRDVEWYAAPRSSLSVIANRGVSGLEGLVSTAGGLSLGAPDSPVVMLAGDLGFLYDTNALWTLQGLSDPINLTVVVVDNSGGQIFGGFPELRGLGNDVYEKVVVAPHNVDIPAVAESFGISVAVVKTLPDLLDAVSAGVSSSGLQVVYAAVDGPDGLAARKAVHAMVAARLRVRREDERTD